VTRSRELSPPAAFDVDPDLKADTIAVTAP